MTKRLSLSEKKSRKPTLRACTFCHSKHLQCLNFRPCANCVKRKIAHECTDMLRKKAKYMVNSESESFNAGSGPDQSDLEVNLNGSQRLSEQPNYQPPQHIKSDEQKNPNYLDQAYKGLPSVPELRADFEFSPERSNNPNHVNQHNVELQNIQTIKSLSPYGHAQHNSISLVDAVKDSAGSTPSTSATGTTNTTSNFHSNFVNQEYMMLGDLISKPSSPSSMDYTAAAAPLMSPGFLSELELETNHSRPFISLHTTEKNFEVAVDPNELNKPQYTSPLVSHHIYQTVQDIYSNPVINFDYPLSYHSLTYFLRNRFAVSDKNTETERTTKRKNFLIILKLIASYRPTFISLHNSLLQPYDIHFLEMSFQRCLLDYENLSRLNASPTIIWRRTGEIVSISNDLVNLLGLSISEILSKRTFIMELMYDDASIVEYFRLFKSVAVGNLHLTIVTKCKLIKRLAGAKVAQTNTKLGDSDFIEFCSVWTVKRDLFDLPMMVVGQFLPILPTNGGIRTY